MTYTKQTWANGEAGGTPVSAARLNHIEDGIEAVSAGIVSSANYGLVPGLLTDQSTQMQAFLNGWATSKGLAVLAPGTYVCNTGLSFNHPTSAARAQYILFAYGVTITSTHVGVILGDALPADQTAAEASLGRRISIYGLTIVGNYPGTGQTGLRLACRSWPQLVDVQVEVCATNFDFIFCLMGQASNCYSAYPSQHGFRCRSGTGLWTGATGPNSASNHFIFTNGTRDYAQSGQLTQFYIEDSQGVVLRDCITEGENSVNAVYYSTNIHDTIYGHSGGRTFTVENHHGENFPTNAHLKISAYSGHVIIDEYDSQTGGTIIDGSGSSITTTIFARLPTIASTPAFKTVVGGPRWFFYPASNYGAYVINTAGVWVGGLIGTAGILRFNDATIEPTVNSPSLGIAGAEPFLHASTDLRLISDRATTGFAGIHLEGPTEIKVGTVPGSAFMQNGYISFGWDDTTNEIVIGVKKPNGTYRTGRLATT